MMTLFPQDQYSKRLMIHNIYFHIQRLGGCLNDVLHNIESTTDEEQYKHFVSCYNHFEEEFRKLRCMLEKKTSQPPPC